MKQLANFVERVNTALTTDYTGCYAEATIKYGSAEAFVIKVVPQFSYFEDAGYAAAAAAAKDGVSFNVSLNFQTIIPGDLQEKLEAALSSKDAMKLEIEVFAVNHMSGEKTSIAEVKAEGMVVAGSQPNMVNLKADKEPTVKINGKTIN